MEPGAVSSFCPAMESVITHDGMWSVRIIIIFSGSCRDSEGVVKTLPEFTEETEMASGSGSEVYWDLLFRQGLLSIVMGRRFKYGLTPPTRKGLLKKS